MKSKSKNKRKLPRYWLGTRKPTSLGYQPNFGIGNAQFSSVKGEDIAPETRALRSSTITNALNKLMQGSQTPLSVISNMKGAASSAAGSAAVGLSQHANTIRQALSFAGLGDVGEAASTALAQQAREAASKGAASAGKTALGTTGTALGAIGTLYGLTDMGFQIANAGDHRTARDMRNTLTTNTYTTPGGNQYTEYGGVDQQAELQYERAQRRSKDLNFAATSIGTGAAAGATIGALAGSSVPVLGTAIGAAGGLIVGGLGSLLGLFDNSEEIEKETKMLADVTSMQNRQSRANALNLDINKGFYDRGQAAKGKMPKYSKGKANAMVSNGETIGQFKDGSSGELDYAYVVPGKVTKNTAFADTKKTHLKDKEFVLSNNEMPGTGLSYSQYANITGDYMTPLIVQDMMNRNKYNQNGTLKAKCGKMPKYNIGRWGDYALSTLPHLGSVLTNLYQYNRVKNAEEYAPTITTEAPAAQNYINRMMAERIDPRQYLNRSLLNYNQAAWNARRTPGMGLGGRMVMLDSLAKAKQAQDADTMLKIDEANRTQRNRGYEAGINLDKYLSEINTKNAWNKYAYRQQAHGQKETWLAQYLKNTDQGLINAAGDALRTSQYHQAMDNQQRELDIWQSKVGLDYLDYLRKLHNMGNSGSSSATTTDDILDENLKHYMRGETARRQSRYQFG